MLLKKVDNLIGPLLIRLLRSPTRNTSQPTSFSRLLIIRPGGIGDSVLLIPVIDRLRDGFPDACIDVLAERRNAQTFTLCTGIGRVFCYDKPADLLAVIRQKYDVVIDSEQWYRLSAVVARSISSPMTIGFATNERGKLFSHPVNYRREEYEQTVFFDLLKPLQLNAPNEVLSCFLTVSAKARRSAKSMLESLAGASFVVLFPGASREEKNWGVEKFRELAKRLVVAGYPVVVVGGKEDIVAGMFIGAEKGVLNLTGKTSLPDTAAIIESSLLLISGDSGVLHIGVGVGATTVALFGPSNVSKWAPRGSRHVIVSQQLACSPCSHFGMMPPCPIGVKCIREIDVDDVFAAAFNLLSVRKIW